MSELENQNEEVLNEVSTVEEPEQQESAVESPEIIDIDNNDDEKDLTELPLPEEEDNKGVDQNKFTKTISKIRMKERERAAAREAQLISQIQQLQIQQMPDISSANMDNIPAPDRDAFDNEQEYINAVVKYNINQEKVRESYIHSQDALRKQQEDYFNKLNDVKDKGSLKYDDFDETVEPLMTNFPVNDIVKKAILKSEFAPDLLYFMGRNLEQSNKLTKIDPIDAVKKIHEMEIRFKEAKKKKVAPNSFTPPVNLKSQGGKTGNPSNEEFDKMTPAQYASWRAQSSKSDVNKWSR